jgi:hypothetical protein
VPALDAGNADESKYNRVGKINDQQILDPAFGPNHRLHNFSIRESGQDGDHLCRITIPHVTKSLIVLNQALVNIQSIGLFYESN